MAIPAKAKPWHSTTTTALRGPPAHGRTIQSAELLQRGQTGEWSEEENTRLFTKLDASGEISSCEFSEYFEQALPRVLPSGTVVRSS